MTVSDIRNGVEVVLVVRPDTSRVVTGVSKEAVLSTAREYSDKFASLRVFDETLRDNVFINSFDGVTQDTPTVSLDYLLIQSMSEAFVERMSPMFTFGSSSVYTAGSDAKSFAYSAVILADRITGDNPLRFSRSYDAAIRATKLLIPGQPRYVELRYRDQVRRGYLTSLAVQKNSQIPNRVDVNFTMFVADSFTDTSSQ